MPNEDIFPSPWNSFMLKYHSFQSAQILLGWIMRQMENRKGGASSECFLLGGINELCRFPASIYFTHSRSPSPPSCGDARTREFPGLSFHRRHIKLSGPHPYSLVKGHVAAAQPSWAWRILRSEPARGKLPGCGTLLRAELCLKHPSFSRKSPLNPVQCGFSGNGRLQGVLYPFPSRPKQEATTS